MATHTSVKPYKCPFCEQGFRTTVHCKKHMKRHQAAPAVAASPGEAEGGGGITARLSVRGLVPGRELASVSTGMPFSQPSPLRWKPFPPTPGGAAAPARRRGSRPSTRRCGPRAVPPAVCRRRASGRQARAQCTRPVLSPAWVPPEGWALPVLPGALCLTVLPRTSPRLVGVKRCGVLSPRAGGPVCPAVARAAGPGASPGTPLLLPAVCERVPRGAARGRGCARRVSPRGASRAARGCGSSRVSLRVCSQAARAWAQLAALTVPRAQSARSRHSPRLSPRAVLR